MKTQIQKLLAKVTKVKETDIEVFVPQRESNGDLTTNIAMKLAGQLKKNPLVLAQEIKAKIKLPLFLAKIEIAKPGYLNFYFNDSVYLENLQQVLKDKDRYGYNLHFKNKRIMIEFAHPNPFKIMHIGHLRNIVLGESLVRLFQAQGAKVIRANYQGDVGMHVAKCVWAMAKIKPNNFPVDISERVSFLGQCYSDGARLFEEDDKVKTEIIEVNRKIYEQNDSQINHLWQTGVSWSLDKFQQIYKRVDSHFDREYLESETLELGFKYVNLALKKGILTKSQGAVVFNGKKYGLDTRVFLNSQCFLTYEGKELGLVYLKLKEYGKLNLHIHNVAVEQKSFFSVVYKVEELLDPKHFKRVNYHNAYEFVGLKSGKMSSRRGQVVTAESILDEANKRIKKIVDKNKVKLTDKEIEFIAVGAVKYAYLKMSPFKYLAFDLDACISFSGDSGPYLQYTYARAMSILRKTKKAKGKKEIALEPLEKQLLQKLLQFAPTIENSVKAYSPNYLATYLNDLAQLFNNFYAKHQVQGNQFRLDLTASVAQVIKNGLYLLGIQTLEKM